MAASDSIKVEETSMKKQEAANALLCETEHTAAAELFEKTTYPWEVLPLIKDFIISLGKTLSEDEYEHPSEDVWISKAAHIYPSAYIAGPCIIGAGTQVRHCAFIRGSALIGRDCVVGNSTELKNVILFDNVQVPHYNYVGDSILGYRSHMGAGSITSNVKSDKSLVKVHFEDEDTETGLKKFGAVLGSRVEVGCGSILNPGTVIGSDTNVYPLSSVRTAVGANSIYKQQGEIAARRHR